MLQSYFIPVALFPSLLYYITPHHNLYIILTIPFEWVGEPAIYLLTTVLHSPLLRKMGLLTVKVMKVMMVMVMIQRQTLSGKAIHLDLMFQRCLLVEQ